MNPETLQKIVDVICDQVGFWLGNSNHSAAVYLHQPDAAGIVHPGGEWIDLFQTEDARSMYYALRYAIRRRNHEAVPA